MWYKQFNLKHGVKAILFLDYNEKDEQEVVSVKAMYDGYFLNEYFIIGERGDSMAFIESCPTAFVQKVIDRIVDDVCSGYTK